MADELEHGDIEAALAARRELGASYDAALVDSFADRVEREIARRVGEDLSVRQRSQRASDAAGPRQLALGIVSAGVGIPITAITMAAADDPSLIGLLVSWTGLGVINWAHAWQSRRP